ncbi:hypothetical protein BX616_001402 [Lobosporangium transversale]|nr:hypothetical protein BX616_001402 [Lobosporangium transversale]
MPLETAHSFFHPSLSTQHQFQHQSHQRSPSDNVMAAPSLPSPSSPSSFSSSAGNSQSIVSPPLTPASWHPTPSPITTNIHNPIRSTRTPILLDQPLSKMPPSNSRGPTKPLTLLHQYQQTGSYTQHAINSSSSISGSAQSSPHTPQTPLFRSHHHISSLPSPPLSSVEPPSSVFFPRSPSQERCEALEAEISTLKLRLKRSEQSSKRMSLFQPSTLSSSLADFQPSQPPQSIMAQYESTLSQLEDTKRELDDVRVSLALKEEHIRQLETIVQDQERKLDGFLSEREALSLEMKENFKENAELQKRLQETTDKVGRLQLENRQLIEQVQELRTKTPEAQTQSQTQIVKSIDSNCSKSSESNDVPKLEKEASKHRIEVDRLQNVVLMMSSRHVQVQTQLTFFQQQAQRLQQQLNQYKEAANVVVPTDHRDNNKAHVPHSRQGSTSSPVKNNNSMMMCDSTLSSLLASVATVAATSHSYNSKRSKPSRRFTVNAPRKDNELTLEQRKCEFLMDQIAVLQRGYDSLRQEKVTLELQLDLMQRQHQYHQQQRQKRRESQQQQRRSSQAGQEQSSALSKALAIMVASSKETNLLSAIPSIPLLPTISAAEQEQEKARIQHELEQAQIRAQKEAEEREVQRLAAKAAAEEAEREAIRLRRQKSIHLKETLASLEAKVDRSESARAIRFSDSEELKHLEHLRLLNEQQEQQRQQQQQQQKSSWEGINIFQNAVAARASRGFMSPFKQHHRSSSSTLLSSPSPAASPSPLSAVTTPSPSSASSASSPSLHPSHDKQQQRNRPANYTPNHHLQANSRSRPTYTLNIEQCSCCLGSIIEL